LHSSDDFLTEDRQVRSPELADASVFWATASLNPPPWRVNLSDEL